MKFKTNAKCGGCSAKIGATLEKHGVQASEWSLDLASPDKVLTVQGDRSAAEIIRIVAEAGFKAEEIG